MAPLPFRPPGFDAPLVPTPAQRRAVRQAVGQMASELAQLDDRALRAVLPALIDARDELRAGLLAWLQDAPDGDKRFTAQDMRNALVNLEGAFAVVKKRLGADMLDSLEDFGAEAGQLSVANLEFELARFSGVFGQSVRPTPINRAAVLAQGNKLLLHRYRSSAARYAGNVLEDLKKQFAIGVARNETFHQLTNRLVRLGGPRGRVALSGVDGDPNAIVEHISEGLFRRYRYWAQRLVRTEMLHAYNAQHLEGIRQANELEPDAPYQKRWDSTMDRRVCEICGDPLLDGAVVELDEEFPGGFDHPPAHPNCRCTVVAWRKEWGEFPTEDEEPAVEADDAEVRATSPHQEQALRGLESSFRAGGWTPAREAIDRDLQAMGLSQTVPLDTTKMMVRKLKPGLLGYHEPATMGRMEGGRIVIDRGVAEKAQQFAKAWNLDSDGVRRSMEEATPLLRALREADEKSDLAAKRKLTQELTSHPGMQLLEGVNALKTIYHEAIHGYGPGLPFAYDGVGKVAEEVTTEVLARREVMSRFGAPRVLYERGNSYKWMIDPLTKRVAELYGVEWDEARSIVERASNSYKRLEERTNSPARAAELFSHQFEEPDDEELSRPRESLLDSKGRAQSKLAYELQGEFLRIWRTRPHR